MINLDNKNILITGGCGFIGSNFIEYINKNYKKVNIVNIDKWGIGHRKMSTHFFINGNVYEEIVYDLSEIDPTSNVFVVGEINKMKYDYVFHFAAESHVDRSISGPLNFIQNNVVGTSKLLEMLRTQQPQANMVNISTDEVYGHLHSKSDGEFTETSRLNPRSPYSASKASSDLIVNSYVETYGMKILTTRCCNNFGPHQADEKFIPTVIRNIINDTPIPVYGIGGNIREWIHVDDHNKSILEILERGNSGVVYNIGSRIEKTNLEMIRDIGNILGVSPKMNFVQDRMGHDFRYALRSIHYLRDFKLIPHMDALRDTVKFYAGKYADFGK